MDLVIGASYKFYSGSTQVIFKFLNDSFTVVQWALPNFMAICYVVQDMKYVEGETDSSVLLLAVLFVQRTQFMKRKRNIQEK
jgi:hypothetical protein